MVGTSNKSDPGMAIDLLFHHNMMSRMLQEMHVFLHPEIQHALDGKLQHTIFHGYITLWL